MKILSLLATSYAKSFITFLYSVSSMDMLSSLDDIEDEGLRSQQNNRGLLPPHATHVLKSWLFQHMLVHF